jgi:hypothetical protein
MWFLPQVADDIKNCPSGFNIQLTTTTGIAILRRLSPWFTPYTAHKNDRRNACALHPNKNYDDCKADLEKCPGCCKNTATNGVEFATYVGMQNCV